MNPVAIALSSLGSLLADSTMARFGRFHRWPSRGLLLDEPLALAEERTDRLRRIYANAGRDAWDGPAAFREAVTKHGGIQATREQREALARVLSTLMWGELAAWHVAAELAERLESADARLAASSQVFDEARHFYILRDYLALLHVPTPPVDPYFAVGARRILGSRDLEVKLLAMQLLAEGGATVLMREMQRAQVEPVLCEFLPLIDRDESRHVALGVLHLPELLSRRSRAGRRRVRRLTLGISNMIGAANLRNCDVFPVVGMNPRTVMRETDRVIHDLVTKISAGIGEGDQLCFPATDPMSPSYPQILNLVLPEPGTPPSRMSRLARGAIDAASRFLPA